MGQKDLPNQSGLFLLVGAILLLSTIVLLIMFGGGRRQPATVNEQSTAKEASVDQNAKSTLNLSSSAFAEGQPIPAKYTCKGENINPPLAVSGVPETAKSLAIVVHDPDAPAKDWVHWTLWNVDPATADIKEKSLPPEAVQGITDFGKPGWGGPCPPSGTHRYFFEAYALDATLDLPESTDLTALKTAIEGHIVAQGQLMGTVSAQ